MKNHNLNIKMLMMTSSLALATALTACGNSGSSGSAAEKVFPVCADGAFDLSKVKEARAKSIATQKAGEKAPTLRTYLAKDVTTDNARKEISLSNVEALAFEQDARHVDAGKEPALEINCKTSEATYKGPGVPGSTLKGKVIRTTANAVVMESRDEKDQTKSTTVTISHVKNSPALLVSIVRREGQRQTVMEWIQESATEKNSEVAVHPSSVGDAVELALKRNSAEALQLPAVKAYQAAKESKAQSMRVKFVDLLGLRDFVLADEEE